VKTLLDYLRVVNQPDNNDALARIINVPSRRIGETTIKRLLEEADQSKITLWNLILGTVQGKRATKTKLATQAEKGIRTLVDIILTARNKMQDAKHPCGTVELINFVLKKINYEEWLEEHHGDVAKGRWANVEELITQASDFEDLVATGYEDEALPEVDGLVQDDQSDSLSRFLANVALASEVKGIEEEGTQTPQVTISTIHAAKGLEWPIVFIPAAYQGSIPHSRAEDTCEERRLLYVAMTRAKSLLYISYPLKNSQGEQTTLSPFLSSPTLGRLLDNKGPLLRSSSIQEICHILRRDFPSPESISKSSELLESHEDNNFPVGSEEEIEEDSRWRSRTGNPTYTKGQQQPKRQHIELGRSINNKEGSTTSHSNSYTTTMDGASSFTAISITMKSTFVSAGSLPVLNEQSVNSVMENIKPDASKLSSKQKRNLTEGQGTLFTFLGKAEPQPLKRSRPNTQDAENTRDFKKPHDPYINLPRANTSHNPIGISPELANHRFPTTSRLRPGIKLEENQPHKPYVFLSSSPVRPLPEPDPVVENPKPVAQATTIYHTTTVNTLQQGLAAKRTLGMKRSMNGWASRKGQGGGFVPPTMKKPS